MRLSASGPPTTGWLSASRNARALLNTYTTCFREKRDAPGPAPAIAEGSSLGVEPPKEKPPPDSFEVIESATRAARTDSWQCRRIWSIIWPVSLDTLSPSMVKGQPRT